NFETEVVEVVAIGTRRRAAGAAELAVDRHQVEQGLSRPQLHQADVVLTQLDAAVEHLAVEVQHLVQIDYAQDKMIDAANCNCQNDRLASQLALNIAKTSAPVRFVVSCAKLYHDGFSSIKIWW